MAGSGGRALALWPEWKGSGLPASDLRRSWKPGAARSALRFVVALVFSLVLGALVWSLRPGSLSAPVNVVGYPSFANFDYRPILLGWRLVVLVLPVVLVAVYAALWRWGPLRAGRAVPAGRVTDGAAPARPASPPPEALTVGIWAAALAVPGVLVWFAATQARTAPGQTWSRTGLIVALGYAAVVVVLALGLRWVRRRRAAPADDRSVSLTASLAAVSAVLGPVLAVGVLAWSSHRTIALEVDGSVTHWTWWPWWVALPLALTGLVWVVHRLRAGADPVVLERRVRSLLLGPVLVLAVTMYLPPPLGYLEGFDDAQSVLGADLLSQGYFPWRDFLFIHGLFEDGLRSLVGWELFEPSIWGALGSYSMVFAPLFWVLLYFLAIYAAPRGVAVPVGVVALAASHLIPVSTRWVLVALVFVVLGEAIRRGSTAWVAGLTVLLFADAVLVPEAVFQVAACFAVLLLHDLAVRRRGVGWWRALPSVRTFVIVGGVLSVLWLGYLATQGAAMDFIEYFLYFGPGHNESGTLPLS